MGTSDDDVLAATTYPPERKAVGAVVTSECVEPTSGGRDGARSTSDHTELLAVERTHYTFDTEIARGGMGRILRARDRRLSREVAVKELLDRSPDARARFEREARITARLQHPAIVNIYEAGVFADAQPFYAMKLVAGESFDRVIDRTEPGARLGLLPTLLAVADALAYAHSLRVIHRDLKPHNILVGEFGETVVIDWGLAKDLSVGVDEITTAARHPANDGDTIDGAVMGTPAYMPREQAAGEPVDERADVYAIGAILYKALSGLTPYSGKTAQDILLAVLDKPPVPLHELVPDAPRDLLTIVDKAMARAPADRYPTARELADDLRRYQTGQLVASHRYSSWQLVRRFARRNRAVLVVAGLLLALLTVTSTISVRRIIAERNEATRQAQRADAQAERAGRRFDDVRRLANSLLFEIDDSIRDLGGTTRARELVVTRALTYLDRLAAEPDRDPALSVELALAYMKIGDVQGSPWDPNIGKPREGLHSYERATQLLAPLDVTDPRVAAARIRALFGTGFMHHTNRDRELARASLTEALVRARNAPTGVELDRVMLARAYLALAFDAKEANNLSESARYTDEGLALVERWPAQTTDHRYWRAAFLLRRADAAMREGDPARAVATLQEIVALHEALAKEFPTIAKYRREQAYALLLLGIARSGVGDSRLWVANTGEIAAAETAFRASLALLERSAAADPLDADAKVLIAVVRTSLGMVVAKRAAGEALQVFAHALAAYEAIPADLRSSTYGRQNEFVLHCAMAHALAVAGRAGEARAQAAIGLELAAGDPFNVATCEALVARMARALGDAAGAIARLESVSRTLEPMADKPDTSALIGLLETRQQLAALRPAEACALHASALGRWRSRLVTTPYLERWAAELDASAARCTRP